MRSTINAGLAAIFLVACGSGSDGTPMIPSPPDPTSIRISDVQGDGGTSPLEGQVVTIEGIVTGDFQDNDDDTSKNLGGFFVQDVSPDSNPQTSDAVFIFDDQNSETDVKIGDRVRVEGTVAEFFGETQIAAGVVTVTGNGTIQPTPLNLPFASLAMNSDGQSVPDLESFEGVLVSFAQTLTISELFNLERFGEVRLSEGGRLYQFTNRSRPSPDGYSAHRETVALRSLVMDDGRRASNATPIPYLDAGTSASTRTGDSVTGLTGNLRYSRGSGGSGTETWRLMPTEKPEIESANPRPGPPVAGGNFRIASLNVLNFFSTIDTGPDVCGPRADSQCRGADSLEEITRQLAKIVTALTMIDADVVGLIELENNSADSLNDIVDAINAVSGPNTYAFVDSGTIGSDTIKTGFLFKPSSVDLVGDFALLDSSVDPRFNDDRNRPALAQTFALADSGAIVTVIVNHLKSKGSDCDADGDPNTSDGQGNCSQMRNTAAAALVDWIAMDPTSSDDPDYLIIGDLNTYLMEDPLSTFRSAGFVNLIETTQGPDAYSFVFDGQSGALDHAVATPQLASQVVDAFEWHINADEARLYDYNLEGDRDPSLFDGALPYRSSDHDPIIVGLELVDP